MSDPRLGKPSASSFGDDVSCPGRRNFLATLPPEELAKVRAPDDADAERGQKIHRAWQTGSTIELEDDELADYTTGLKHIDDVIANWARENSLTQFKELQREERLWLHDDRMQATLSGQVDRWYVSAPHLLIIDGKSGWSTYVPASNRSWQLRCYAVLGWQNLDGIEQVRVAYVKPKLKSDPTDYTDYSQDDLTNSAAAILYNVWLTKQPEAPRHAGIQCRFCAAKPHCPEAGAYSLLPSVIAHNALSNGDPVAAVQQLVPADLVKIWSASTVVGKIFDAVKARLKGMTPEQLSELGLERGKGKTTRKVNNARAVINALKAMNLSEEKIDEILKLSVPDIAMLLRREVGMSAQGAPQWCKDNLAAWLDEAVSDAPIERLE